MNLLLFLFAIPFAVIVFSIILQKIINNPTLVAFATFSVFVLIAAIIQDDTYYLLTVIYAILSYIAALSTRIFENLKNRCVNNQESIITNDYNNDTCDSSDVIINKNNMNRKYWR